MVFTVIFLIICFLEEIILPDRSWLILFLFISVTFIIGFFSSFAHSYISALSDKRLEKDINSDNSSNAKKMMKLAEKREKYVVAFKSMSSFNAVMYGVCLAVLLFLSICEYLIGVNFVVPYFSASDLYLFVIGSHLGMVAVGGFIYYLFCVSIPERVGFKSAKNESGSYKIYPVLKTMAVLARIFNCIPCTIASLFNGKDDTDKFVTEDEILQLVDKGEESGGIESVEKELIENIFDFSNIRAGDVMTHRTALTAINIESTEREILDILDETEYSRFPVYRDDIDNIVGIISAKRFYANLTNENKLPLEELIFKPYLVPESIHGDVLLEEMQKRKTHMAVVVDEYGGTCGIVTMEDLLEKIVGNIYDETDDPATETEIIKLEDNLWRIAGNTSLLNVCAELEITIEGEEGEELDFDTLGGLIFSCLTIIPEDGTNPVVDAYGLHIEVELMSDRRVEWARVSLLNSDPSEDEE